MDILNYIPTGSKNAITRQDLSTVTGMHDREMRKEIHKARRIMPILNLQRGDGYAIPDMNDEHDRELLIQYVQQEESRLKSIGWSLMAARKTLKNLAIDYKDGDFAERG